MFPFLSFSLSVFLSVCLSVSLYLYLCVYLYLSLPPFLSLYSKSNEKKMSSSEDSKKQNYNPEEI